MKDKPTAVSPAGTSPRLKLTVAHPHDPTLGYIGSFAVAGSRVYAAGGAALAARVHDGDPGAEMVLEDALRERGLW